MESRWCWMLVALCALLMSTGAALADDVAVKGAEVMQEQAVAAQELSVKHNDGQVDVLQPLAVADEVPVKVDVADEHMPVVIVEQEAEKSDEKVEDVDEAQPKDSPTDEQVAALEAAINAEIEKKPELQRLARELRNFHEYQVARGRKAAHANGAMQRAANNIGDEDYEEALAEERAVRRRKRVRRRNSKNKVRRTHRNKHFANRKKNTQRKHSKRNSVRRKNVRRTQTNRRVNTRVRPASSTRRRSPQRRSGSSKKSRRSNKRRSGGQKAVRSSKRKSSQRKKSNRRRKHKNQVEDDTSGRKQDSSPVGPIGEDNVVADGAAAVIVQAA